MVSKGSGKGETPLTPPIGGSVSRGAHPSSQDHRSIADLKRDWVKLVGHQIGGTTTPFMVTESGTLIIQTASPILTGELEKYSEAIVASLPEIDGRRIVEVRFAYAPPTRPRREHFARGRR